MAQRLERFHVNLIINGLRFELLLVLAHFPCNISVLVRSLCAFVGVERYRIFLQNLRPGAEEARIYTAWADIASVDQYWSKVCGVIFEIFE